MNKQIITWADQDKGDNTCGAFREKDLQFLYKQCVAKYQLLQQLTQQKEELIAKGAFNQNAQKIDEEVKESKAVASPPRKKFIENKYKCNVKSCGKVFNTQSSFSAHVKKHNEKKGRRNEQGQSQNQLVNQGQASQPIQEQ